MESIYRRVAGAAFDHLPDAVKRAHGHRLSGRGVVDVRWSPRRAARMAARAMGLPPEGNGLPLKLEVREEGSTVVYDRWFGGFHLRTAQDLHRGLLREKAGPASFLYHLDVDGERLRYRMAGVSVAGVPLPPWMRTEVAATIEAWDAGWRASISIDAPGLGRICDYEARMRFG